MTESNNNDSKGDPSAASGQQTLASHKVRTGNKKKHKASLKKFKFRYSAGEEEDMTLALALSASLEVNLSAMNVIVCMIFQY